MSVNVSNSLSVISTDAATNTAVVRYTVICSTSGESYNLYDQTGDFWVDGQHATSEYILPLNSDTIVFDDYFTVSNASGRTISASYSFPTTPAGGTKTGGTSVTIPDIPRYANITSFYVSSTGLNSITVYWNTDCNCDWLQYSLNGGNWIDAVGHPEFTINGLSTNTSYNIKIKVRRTDSQLWTESNTITGTTKDIARITSAPNINHGDNLSISYSNPSGSSLKIALYTGDGQTVLAAYRNCSGAQYEFVFTDEELDTIYRRYGNARTINARAYIKTANTYTAYSNLTITLTGNQKTIKFKVQNTWHRAKIKTKISNTWRKAVMWRKEDGVWHRSI